MNRNSKLALFIAVLLILQVSLSGWSIGSQQVEAATSGPIAIGLTPADDLTNVPISAHLQMVFDENVVRGPESTTVSIREYGTGRVLESISMSSSRVSIDSTKRIVTINLEKSDSTKALALNTEYYVLVDAGALLNESNGSVYAGIDDASKWNFRTVAVNDVTRPLLKSTNPDTNFPVNVTTPITLTFDEPVYAASGNILISSTEGDDIRTIAVTSSAVSGSGSANNKIVIQPPAALQPSKTYTVTIPGTAFRDAAGNFYLGTSWQIVTGKAPVNLRKNDPLLPADNATSVKTDSSLTMVFDRNVQARSNKLIEIRRVSNNSNFDSFDALNTDRVKVTGDEVKIVPSKPFEPNTSYYVLIAAGAFTQPDPYGSEWYHGISGANIWNFTTDPGTEKELPYVKSYSPVQNGVSGNTNTLLQLTFNEPVFPSEGNIEVREAATGNLFRSIPITSERVTGGGSYQLTIDPNRSISGELAKAFVINKRYYVTIGNHAIRDAAHNYYTGITSNSVWTFTITQDTVRPTLGVLSPVNNATAVRENETFVASFSKAIMKGAGDIKFYKVGAGATANPIIANVVVDGKDNKKLLITPKVNLDKNSSYYIYIPENGVTDLVGNTFVGILNEYQWTFKTIGSDTVPPVLSRAEAVGSTIRLIYNEPLNAGIWPSTGSFYVTVNGAPYPVTTASVAGDTVTLTLSSSIINGQLVKVSYTKEAAGRIRDLSDNEAASFSNKDVGTGQDTTIPTIVSGTASGSTITLTFSKALMQLNSNAYLQFMVNVGGVNYNANSISSNGSTVTLSINGVIQGTSYVLVTYTPGSYPLRDLAGNHVIAFSSYASSGTSTNPGQTGLNLQSISASGTSVTLRYDKTINPQYLPSTYQYTVLVDNITRPVSQVAISGTYVILTLSTSIASGQKVVVSYVAIGNTLIDLFWNTAQSFNSIQANGGGTGQSGALLGATLKGAALTLTFSENLHPASIPGSNLFSLRINDLVRSISRVEIIGTTAILTLSSPAAIGDRASITYTSSISGLNTISGLAIGSFSNVNVTNQTTLIDGLTGDYEAAEGGVGLKTTAATLKTDVSPAGVTANRYTVNTDKFLVAYETAIASGLMNPRIVFKVPVFERAAIVAIPVIALNMANRQNGKTVFAIEHGDVTYELPLNALNYAELSNMLNGNSISNHILIEIDQGTSSKSTVLTTMLNSSKAQVIAGPVHFEVSLVNGSQEKILTDFNSYISRTIKTSLAVDTSQTSVVWYDSEAGSLSYIPTELTTAGGKTVATFKRKGNSAYALVRNSASFTDVSKHWAAETINTMARKYIVEGKTTTKFEPDKNITRGEFATYIAKGLGLQGDKAAAAKFKDVTSNTAMGAYIGAAVKAGIVKGNTDGTFKPNNPITRQDMAAMMMRAAKVAELTVSPPNSTASYLQNFTDKGKISSYAKTDVAQAVYLGIITGKNAKTLSPLTNATRAEGTVMLMRLLEKAKFLTP